MNNIDNQKLLSIKKYLIMPIYPISSMNNQFQPKLFTVKDFISYNGPCFNCRSKIDIWIGSTTFDNLGSSPLSNIVSLIPTITSKNTKLDLVITYANGTNIVIDHKTNSFTTNNISGLKHYLNNHNLFINSHCIKCYTHIISSLLEFDLYNNYVKPFSLWYELLKLFDNKNSYQIETWFNYDRSTLTIASKGSPDFYNPPIEDIFLPKYQFPNKQKLIEKCQMCLTFQ
jgi:hypothetical protein